MRLRSIQKEILMKCLTNIVFKVILRGELYENYLFQKSE